jgi:hypothetical protein
MSIGCLGVERRVERFFSYLAIFRCMVCRAVDGVDKQFVCKMLTFFCRNSSLLDESTFLVCVKKKIVIVTPQL